jgi:starch synthase
MKEPELLKKYGEAGRKRAAAEFGWPAVACATLALYQSLIK